MQITVTGVDTAAREIGEIPTNLAVEVIRKMAAIAYDAAEAGAGAHSRAGGSGALLQSLYNRQVEGGPSRAVGHDPQRAPHALWVNFGTRAHEIRPRNKRVLRWPGAGGFVFAAWAKHPGYRGDPYIIRAADAAVAKFHDVVTLALKEA